MHKSQKPKKPKRLRLNPLEQRSISVKYMPFGKAEWVNKLFLMYRQSPQFKGLKLTTRKTYESVMRLFETYEMYNGKTLVECKVQSVNFQLVEYIKNVLVHTYSPGYVRVCFSVMYVIWDYALKNMLAIQNPWAKPNIHVDDFRDITWSQEQIESAIKASEDIGCTALRIMLIFCYETAQRPWSDVYQFKMSNIKREVISDIVEDETGAEKIIKKEIAVLDFIISKTNTRIVLPLSDTLKKEIDALPPAAKYLLVDSYGNRLSKSGILAQFERVKIAAGLPDNLQIRDVRRTVITEMSMAGATREQIRAVSGWKSDAVINRYSRLRLQTAKIGMQKLWDLRKALKA